MTVVKFNVPQLVITGFVDYYIKEGIKITILSKDEHNYLIEIPETEGKTPSIEDMKDLVNGLLISSLISIDYLLSSHSTEVQPVIRRSILKRYSKESLPKDAKPEKVKEKVKKVKFR